MPNVCRYCGMNHDNIVLCYPKWRMVCNYTDPSIVFDASVSSAAARQQELADAVPALAKMLELFSQHLLGMSVERHLHHVAAQVLRKVAADCQHETPLAADAMRSIADAHERYCAVG